MRRGIHRLMPLFFWALALAVVAGAAQAQSAKRLALVIGNDIYRNIPALTNARNDARLMQGLLQRAGFDVTLATDLDRDRLWSAVETFKRRIGKGDEVVFYFAGHGVQIGSNQLLLPVDINARSDEQVQRDAVPLVEVQEALRDARFALLVVDACRYNPFPKQGTRTIGGTRGLLPPEPASGQVIVMSAGRDQKALDSVPGSSASNGLFTYELTQALQQPGLEIGPALQMVRDRVDDKAKGVGHQQRPSLASDQRGNFFFFGPTSITLTSPQAPATVQRDPEEEAWAAAQRAHSERAYSAYLAAYPTGRFTAAARIALAGFETAPVVTGAAPSRPPQQSPLAGAAAPGTSFKDCADCPEMVAVPAGSFTMGSPAGEEGRVYAEGPQRRVSIGYAFAVGKHEVTRGEYARFALETGRGTAVGCLVWAGQKWEDDSSKSWRSPGFTQTDSHPVVCVDWNDAKAYAAWLSAKTGKNYRLLSEAEWEYVARAGSTTTFNTGTHINPGQANFNGNFAYAGSAKGTYLEKTALVGSYPPNAFGLHDMHGNVWEWTEDCWNDRYTGAPSDGRAWSAGECGRRALRGGSWYSPQQTLRSAFRDHYFASNRRGNIGLRLARTP